jgi:hypothetical protein
MFLEWQTPIALAIVAAAIAVLTQRIVRWWFGLEGSGPGGCGGCPSSGSSCGGSGSSKELPLVGLKVNKDD